MVFSLFTWFDRGFWSVHVVFTWCFRWGHGRNVMVAVAKSAKTPVKPREHRQHHVNGPKPRSHHVNDDNSPCQGLGALFWQQCMPASPSWGGVHGFSQGVSRCSGSSGSPAMMSVMNGPKPVFTWCFRCSRGLTGGFAHCATATMPQMGSW